MELGFTNWRCLVDLEIEVMNGCIYESEFPAEIQAGDLS